jgi:hypothetical protein
MAGSCGNTPEPPGLVVVANYLKSWVTLESELFYDWRFTANQFDLAKIPLRLTTSNFFFQLNTCRHSLHVTSSLTRGYVSHLHLLLLYASAVVLSSESRKSHDHILLGSLLSPHATRRAIVEVFETSSTRHICWITFNSSSEFLCEGGAQLFVYTLVYWLLANKFV